ncbi:hypothetical protein Glove_478g24 [Diversispora epigaea]|uniref:Protein kinase domain-containing protein n=1 Tax=Diversispora epigaea TaxID=1348612 RepID=A0A397GKD0_9GLOM|nr:hypothetical protein Glove_478g24 [Diversispora epigaea]
MTSRKDLLESALKDERIEKFDHNKFKEIPEIARGGFGTVYHPSTETYYLILQYSKDGDLRTDLRNNFNELDWKTKINMAKDITSGLRCIHEENIVHKDLNILVHEGSLLITDLGLSQSLDTDSISMASDIYSLGVLFWELSCGRPPFDNMNVLEICSKVTSGERENTLTKHQKNKSNDNHEAYNNQSQALKDEFSRDSISIPSSFITSNWGKLPTIFPIKFTPIPFPSNIITNEHVLEISSGSRDGFDVKTIYNICDKVSNTVIILKVEGTGEILGGYNPLE